MLQNRISKFIAEFEMPVTVFCRKVKISTAAYYKYMHREMEFSDDTRERITDYLSKYGF